MAEQRSTADVGRRAPVHSFKGAPIGDDVTWKGTKVLRCVALQTAGSGGSLREWGRWWGDGLKSLGADVGVLTETRIMTEAAQDQAVKGLAEAGFHAVSHNVTAETDPVLIPEDGAMDPRSSGVIIAVRCEFVGQWREVARDSCGRGLASSLTMDGGVTVRVVGLYGVAGSCTPSFLYSRVRMQAERKLVEFARQQLVKCDAEGLHCLLCGDMNSYTSDELDHLGSPSSIRPGCLAPSLEAAGCRDAFRERHPFLRAYTYASRTQTASRFDQVWVRSPPGATLDVLNAAIIWGWPNRTDHEPVVVDVACSFPRASDLPQAPGRAWRKVVSDSLDKQLSEKMRESVLESIQPRREEIEDACTRLRLVRDTCRNRRLSHTQDGATWNDAADQWAESQDFGSAETRAIIESCASAIEGTMNQCVPWPRPPVSRAQQRASDAWQGCIFRLRSLRTRCCGLSGRASALCSDDFAPIEVAWRRAWYALERVLAKRAHGHQGLGTPIPAAPPLDAFRTSPAQWARDLGFSVAVAEAWGSDLRVVTRREDIRPSPTDGIPPRFLWAADTASPRHQVGRWIELASRARQVAARLGAHEFHSSRIAALRSGDIATWAKLARRPSRPAAIYAPTWLQHPSGVKTRPNSPSEALLATSQEWSELLCEPVNRWSSPLVRQWRDAAGRLRGSARLQSVAPSDGSLEQRVLRGFLGAAHSTAGVSIVTWTAASATVINDRQIKVGGWILSSSVGGWVATRPLPCPGIPRHVAAVGADPPSAWSMDRWAWAFANGEEGFCLLVPTGDVWGDLVRPLSTRERADAERRSKWSRPGPSWWKVAFVQLFPDWAREAYWLLTDVQRECGLIASVTKKAVQVNLGKPTGGFRPVAMLEESLKVIEGPVARRRVRARRSMPDGSVYSAANLAGESGRQAAAEVLYLDALVCEDAGRFARPLCRLPADYEKFFNAIQLSVVDAVDQCRGLPDAARAVLAEALSGVAVEVETRWGRAPPITSTRGAPQGSVSGPEASHPAQEPILRVRESSAAAYITSAGRRVSCTGFVDDAEHYGAGAAHLPLIVKELGAGSMATGIAFSWSKFSAYATDWDAFLATPAAAQSGMTHDAIAATGWDIKQGVATPALVPRSHADTVEKLLGKRGQVSDRHSHARADLMLKVKGVIRSLRSSRAPWDECAITIQLRIRGVINYCPLIGIPRPVELHAEDGSLQRLLLHAFATRDTSERIGLLARQQVGGAQLPSVVESMVAAVMRDVLALINGTSPASQIARDTLRQAMVMAPCLSADHTGVVTSALRFLSGYGIYVGVSTDRWVGRLLDAHQHRHRIAFQKIVLPFRESDYLAGGSLCRVGPIANSLRMGCAGLRSAGTPFSLWCQHNVWAPHLPVDSPISPQDCAAAVALASPRSERDWRSERLIFGANPNAAGIGEDWSEDAWEWPFRDSVDRRSSALCELLPAQAQAAEDIAVFGDGGFASRVGATFAAGARTFGPPGQYWETGRPAADQISGRLPDRYGHDHCTIHIAELASLVTALRWCQPRRWNLAVMDRSALFPVMERVSSGPASSWFSCVSAPLEMRLRRILGRLSRAWDDSDQPPSWRLSQMARPELWNVKRSDPDDPLRSISMCAIAFDRFGLVGVDIKSHQVGPPCPYPVMVEGNEVQDRGCDEARGTDQPHDIFVPTGGFFAYAVVDGRMVTGSSFPFSRKFMRDQADAEWPVRAVQGKVGSIYRRLYTTALDLQAYTCCYVEPRWRWTLLTSDTAPFIDLSSMLFRCIRALAGGWTEMLHSDAALADLSRTWATGQGLVSPRVCPLCKCGAGTPRHVVMRCLALSSVQESVRDMVEAELAQNAMGPILIAAAVSLWERESEHGFTAPVAPPAVAARWPILSAWRWLVPIPEVETFIGDSLNQSADGARRETHVDLAYRGVLPWGLGRALCAPSAHGGAIAGVHDEQADGAGRDEEFATQSQAASTCQESQRRRQLWRTHAPALRVTTALVLGLRKLRAEYAERIAAWRELYTSEEVRLEDNGGPIPHLGEAGQSLAERLGAWASTPAGRVTVAQLRWSLLPVAAASVRIRADFGPRIASDDGRLRKILSALAIPTLQGGGASWGERFPEWEMVRATWQSRCLCAGAAPDLDTWLCARCGGAQVPSWRPVPAPMQGKCRWCQSAGSDVCPACRRAVHFRGACGRWPLGASPKYARRGDEEWWLCPDCMAKFMRAVHCGPVRHRLRDPFAEYAAHMVHAAEAVIPGAGARCARPRINRIRLARNFITSYVGPRRWVTVRRVAEDFRQHRPVTVHGALPPQASDASVQQAISSLVRRGELWQSRDGRAVHHRTPGTAAPAYARSRGVFRRRARSAQREPSPREASLRRRI